MKKPMRPAVCAAAAVPAALCGSVAAFASDGKDLCLTGDNRHIIFAVIILILAGAAAAVSIILAAVKKRKRSR